MESEDSDIVYLIEEDGTLSRVDLNALDAEDQDDIRIITENLGPSNNNNGEVEDLAVKNLQDLTNVPSSSKSTIRNADQHLCETCGKIFGKKSSLTVHSKLHNDQKEFRCYVENCGMNLSSVSSFKAHFDKLHKLSTSKKYAVRVEYSLERAREEARNYYSQQQPSSSNENSVPNKIYSCRKGCDKVVNSLSTLYYHEKSHLNILPFKCQHCDYAAKESFEMKRHYSSQHPTAIYNKESCKQSTNVDEEASAPITFPCDKCHQIFNFKYQLDKHTPTHNLFSCIICNKTFMTKRNAQAHEAVHSGERKLKCDHRSSSGDECGKSFKYRQQLTAHRYRVHLGVKYTCSMCQATLTSRAGLIQHRKIHNQFVPKKCSGCKRTFFNSRSYSCHIRVYQNGGCGTTAQAQNFRKVGMKQLTTSQHERIIALRKNCKKVVKSKLALKRRLHNVRLLVWPCNYAPEDRWADRTEEEEMEAAMELPVEGIDPLTVACQTKCTKLAFCWTSYPIPQMRLLHLYKHMLNLRGCISINIHHLDDDHDMHFEDARFIVEATEEIIVRAVKRLFTEFVPQENLTHVARAFPLFDFDVSVYKEVARIIHSLDVTWETELEILDRITLHMNRRVPRYRQLCRNLPQIIFRDGIFSFRVKLPPPRHSSRRLLFNMDFRS